MSYTHLLFDHDGVLVNTEHLYLQAIQEQLATLGIDLAESDEALLYSIIGVEA